MTDANGNLIERIFAAAPFVRSLGIELASYGDGWCETRLPVTRALEQQHGVIHAGALMTLADHTCGGAAATTAPAGREVITIENKVSFLRPGSATVLLCRATVLRAGKRIVFVEADVTTESKTVVAKASSTLAFIPLTSR
jgi:uncharacterized protein (TIGR00369 family)